MLEEISRSTPAVMSGTGQEVARLLHQTPEQKTVAVTFPDDEHGRAAEQVVRQALSPSCPATRCAFSASAAPPR